MISYYNMGKLWCRLLHASSVRVLTPVYTLSSCEGVLVVRYKFFHSLLLQQRS